MSTKKITFDSRLEMERQFAELQCIYPHCEFVKIGMTFALVAVFS